MELFRKHSFYLPDFSGLFWLVMLFIIGQFVGSLVISILILSVSQEFANVYGTLISYPIMFIPVFLYASYHSGSNAAFGAGYKLDSSNFGKTGGFGIATIAALMTIAAAFVSEPLGKILPDMPESIKNALDSLVEGPAWVSLLSVSVFAPILEEWLCRGLVLRGMLKKVRPGYAIAISAAFFALIHMNPWQALPAFILGSVFGYVYYRTGSLKLTILMHSVNNTMAFIVSRIPALENADYFSDVMSGWAYAAVVAASALILVSGLVIIRNIPIKNPSGIGNCDEVTPEI